MKLSGFKRLNKEDVSEQFRPLMDRLGYSINNFADEVINAFNSKGISLQDNTNTDYKQIDVTVDSAGLPKITTSYKSGLNGRTLGVVVVSAQNLTNTVVYPTNQPFISFSENSGIITINHISGLQADNKYRLFLVALGN